MVYYMTNTFCNAQFCHFNCFCTHIQVSGINFNRSLTTAVLFQLKAITIVRYTDKFKNIAKLKSNGIYLDFFSMTC